MAGAAAPTPGTIRASALSSASGPRAIRTSAPTVVSAWSMLTRLPAP